MHDPRLTGFSPELALPGSRERLFMAYVAVSCLPDLPPRVLAASRRELEAAPPDLVAWLRALLQQGPGNLDAQGQALDAWFAQGRKPRWN